MVKDDGSGFEGLDLELVDAQGRTIATARSDYDGFSLFERVAYGGYSFRLAADLAKALRLTRAIDIKAKRQPRQTGRAHRRDPPAPRSAPRAARDRLHLAASDRIRPHARRGGAFCNCFAIAGLVARCPGMAPTICMKKWCGREDSEFPWAFAHNDLNVARLPVPPRPHVEFGQRIETPAAGEAPPLAKALCAPQRPKMEFKMETMVKSFVTDFGGDALFPVQMD